MQKRQLLKNYVSTCVEKQFNKLLYRVTEVKNILGVMQGRLLPKYQGRYQAHPIDEWQKEFEVAKEIELDCIEFILDYNNAIENPLLKEEGIKQIKSVIAKTGVTVKTICADYFMEAPLHSENFTEGVKSQKIMETLLYNAAQLGVSDVVLPCVDQSKLHDKKTTDRFINMITPLVIIAERLGVNLSLETDLAPYPFASLLKQCNLLCNHVLIIVMPHVDKMKIYLHHYQQ